jgi:hypothetical protein
VGIAVESGGRRVPEFGGSEKEIVDRGRGGEGIQGRGWEARGGGVRELGCGLGFHDII